MGVIGIITTAIPIIQALAEAGVKVWALWDNASKIIRDAEETGKVDEAAYQELINVCNAEYARLEARVDQAKGV